MTKVTNIDRQAIRQINDRIKPEVERLLAEMGLSITGVKMTYGGFEGSIKLEFATGDAEQEAFCRDCAVLGFAESDYRAAFTLNGKAFKLVGFHLRSPKRPIIAEAEDGKTYKIDKRATAQIKAQIGAAA